MAKAQTKTSPEEQDFSFLDEDFMEADLEKKVLRAGEYKLAFTGIFFSEENEDEVKQRDKNGNLYCTPIWTVVDGDLIDVDGDPIDDPDQVRTFTSYLGIPELSRHTPAEVKDRLESLQTMLDALNFDPGRSGREIIEDRFRFLKEVAERKYECWAKVKQTDDVNYGKQNGISRFTRTA